MPRILDRWERQFKRSALALHSRRFHMLRPVVEHILATKQVPEEGVHVPGEALWLDMFREYYRQVLVEGMLNGRQHLHDVRQAHEFAESDRAPFVPQDAIDFLRGRVVLQGKWNRDLDSAVTQVLVNAVQQGATITQVMDALGQVFPAFSRRRLETIARTETAAAFVQGNLAVFRRDKNTTALQYVAIEDDRTCPICMARDGLVLRIDDPRVDSNTPPLHYNCRCMWSPLDDWHLERMGRKGGPRPGAGWDAAPAPMDGFGRVPEQPKGAGSVLPPRPEPSRPSAEDNAGPERGKVQQPADVTQRKREIIDDLLMERRITLEERLLREAPELGTSFEGSLRNVEAAIRTALSRLPEPHLDAWRKSEQGHLTITAWIENEHLSKAGQYDRRTTEARIALWALAEDRGVLEEEITHLIDHLLGSDGLTVHGGNLSEGSGTTKRLLTLGREIRKMWKDPANQESDYGADNPREFLAQWARAWLTESHAKLQAGWPVMYNWLRDKWFSEPFWRDILK